MVDLTNQPIYNPANVGPGSTWTLEGPLWIELWNNGPTDVPSHFHTKPGTVKSNLTRSLKYRFLERDVNGVLSPERQDHFFNYIYSIYKMGKGQDRFYCIFHPKSDLGWKYINGDLNAEELRDSIEW